MEEMDQKPRYREVDESSLGDFLHGLVQYNKKNNLEFACMMISLHQIKKINSEYGILFGNKMIQSVEESIKSVLNESHVIIQFQGTHFVVIMKNTQGKNEIEGFAKGLIKKLNTTININGKECIPLISVGVSIYPASSDNVEGLIDKAFSASHQAYVNGKKHEMFYESSINYGMKYNRILENDLRLALKNNEFTVVFQPKVDVINRSVVGMEALIRWHNAQIGDVPPSYFIPIAEKSGAIIEIGRWVLQESVKAFCRLNEKIDFKNNFSVSVNVSPVQLEDEDFLLFVKNVLLENNIKENNLELEITETALMKDVDKTVASLKKVKDIGVRISVDDFGSGYSSLNYLSSLPIHIIKLDRVFVENIDLNSTQLVIQSVIKLAKKMGLDVIVEGVETSTQAEILKSLGCQYLQGFFYGIPMEESDLLARLLRGK